MSKTPRNQYADATHAGLVNNTPGNTAGTPILGKTDGAAVGAGIVGQVINVSSSITPTYISVTDSVYSDIGGASLPLSVGTWLVYAGITFEIDGISGSTGWRTMSLRLTDSANNVIYTGYGHTFNYQVLATGSAVSMVYPLVVTSPTTYKLRAASVTQTGNASATSMYAYPYGYFFAVRVA